ncbi:MAG: hypothetical protein Q8918_15195 [Bacteroidota bacterium]|nr:hypothetical protein [Bacteroidota bacterium]MDP4251447.1 hypothetical protein [Bacteroidota bacterium]
MTGGLSHRSQLDGKIAFSFYPIDDAERGNRRVQRLRMKIRYDAYHRIGPVKPVYYFTDCIFRLFTTHESGQILIDDEFCDAVSMLQVSPREQFYLVQRNKVFIAVYLADSGVLHRHTLEFDNHAGCVAERHPFHGDPADTGQMFSSMGSAFYI